MFKQITLLDLSKPIAARRRKRVGPYRWLPTRAGRGRGFYLQHDTRNFVCADHGAGFTLRLAHANEGMHNPGRLPSVYTAGEFGDTEFLPIVARLPGGRGFLSGWTMGPGMCAELSGTIWSNEDDAGRYAHDMARHAAETEDDANEGDE